jgi:hypothetical protein
MRIAGSVSLGNFWLSMIRKYGRGVLDGDQIRWIVEAFFSAVKRKFEVRGEERLRARSAIGLLAEAMQRFWA